MFWHWKTPGRRKACISARVRCPILSASLYRTLRGGQTGLVCHLRISEMGHDFLHGGGSAADSGDYRREDASVSEIVSPQRFSPRELAKTAAMGAKAVKYIGKRLFQIPKSTVRDLKPGHGAVVRTAAGKMGVYRDEEGKFHAVSGPAQIPATGSSADTIDG